MLAVGRERARVAGVANVEFVADDAARRQFATQSFDAVISRFGLMFFDDPVMAFTNLRHALRIGGRLAIDAVSAALAEIYEPGRGVALGTGAWLVSALRAW